MKLTLSKPEQRERRARFKLIAVAVELQLRALIREILSGDTQKLVDFQQLVQEAPPEMKARLLDLIERSRP